MNLFLSGTPNKKIMSVLYDNYDCSEINLLASYEYRCTLMGHNPAEFKNFIADSGAFTAMTTGKKIDDVYISEYAKWVQENCIHYYMEMDLDEVVGCETTRQIRKRLEEQVGWKSIPVWHLERGWQGWYEMCDNYDYVALSLSGFTKASKWLQKHKWKPLDPLLLYAKKTHTKVHALGCNRIQLMKKYHFYSCDSSVFTSGSRYGNVLQFKDGQFVKIPNGKKRKDYEKVDMQNISAFMEAIKYAEVHM